jgi:hypothetical protein
MVEYVYKYQKFGAEITISIKCEGNEYETSLDVAEGIILNMGYTFPYEHLVTFSQEK